MSVPDSYRGALGVAIDDMRKVWDEKYAIDRLLQSVLGEDEMKFNLEGYLEAQGVNVAKLERRTIERVRELRTRMNEMASKEQTAWLIERRDQQRTMWLLWRGMAWGWTPDVNESMKFADYKSADQVKKTTRDNNPDVYICEHSWPEGF